MLERIYRQKADRDAKWAILDSNTAYQQMIQKAQLAQTNAMAQIAAQQAGATERTQMGITAQETKAEQGRLASEQAQQGLLERTGFASASEAATVRLQEQQEMKAVEVADAKARDNQLRKNLFDAYGEEMGWAEDFVKTQDPDQLWRELRDRQKEDAARVSAQQKAKEETPKMRGDAYKAAATQYPSWWVGDDRIKNPDTGKAWTFEELDKERRDAARIQLDYMMGRTGDSGAADTADDGEKRIRVLRKSNKEPGTILADDFDPAIYDKRE